MRSGGYMTKRTCAAILLFNKSESDLEKCEERGDKGCWQS